MKKQPYIESGYVYAPYIPMNMPMNIHDMPINNVINKDVETIILNILEYKSKKNNKKSFNNILNDMPMDLITENMYIDIQKEIDKEMLDNIK